MDYVYTQREVARRSSSRPTINIKIKLIMGRASSFKGFWVPSIGIKERGEEVESFMINQYIYES